MTSKMNCRRERHCRLFAICPTIWPMTIPLNTSVSLAWISAVDDFQCVRLQLLAEKTGCRAFLHNGICCKAKGYKQGVWGLIERTKHGQFFVWNDDLTKLANVDSLHAIHSHRYTHTHTRIYMRVCARTCACVCVCVSCIGLQIILPIIFKHFNSFPS